MTSKGHRLDKFAHTPALKRIIERGPWASYARCDECGVDAGLACRDEHDREALEVCDGRRLAIDDSVARCKPSRRDQPPSMSPDIVYRRRTGRVGEPRYAPCQCCGELTRLWGRAVEEERTWCSAVECREAHRVARLARRKERERPPKPVVSTTCWFCGCTLTAAGVQKKAKRPSCGATVCRRAIDSANRRDNRQRAAKP